MPDLLKAFDEHVRSFAQSELSDRIAQRQSKALEESVSQQPRTKVTGHPA